jgi:hypothetical protein
VSGVALIVPPAAEGAAREAVTGLADGLARRGHEVTLLSSEPVPAPPTGVEVRRHRAPHALMRRRSYEPGLADLAMLSWRLLRGGYDIAHAFAPAHAWTAVEVQRAGGPTAVVSFSEAPTRCWLVARRYRIELLLQAVASAGAVTVPTAEAASACRRYLLREPLVAPTEPERFEGVYEVAAS